MSLPVELHELIERFDRERETYRSGSYNEAQARVDFLLVRLHLPEKFDLIRSSETLVQVISLLGRYAFDDEGLYFTGGGNGPYDGVRWSDPEDRHSLYYLRGLLNSRLLDFYVHSISTTFRGGYWSYGKRFIE